MSEIQTKLDYAEIIADWFVNLGADHILRGELENGLKCNYIAANILCRQNRILSCSGIELNLHSVARCLGPQHGLRGATPPKCGHSSTCLHVMSHALPLGGVTAMATRWIRNDQSGRIHSVALLAQELAVPEQLLQAARGTGGDVYTAEPGQSFLQRAVWLRNLASEVASFVILHIDVSDVIAGVAFGTSGGPPVMLVNHTAHVFWTGVSIADLILNCRGSVLEGVWAAKYRGTPRFATVPIPLLDPTLITPKKSPEFDRKSNHKTVIGLPEDCVVILTVGAYFKYLPANGLDFLNVCESIVKELPEAYLLLVGLSEDERWKSASRRSGGRIRALGILSQSQLAMIHEATDVYVEGFPFGTTTSLLEAGLKGIPVVLSPSECQPPYGSDGVALDDVLERPASVLEYKRKVILLARSLADRAYWGTKFRAAVTSHHTGKGWNQHLESVMQKIPQKHMVYPPSTPARTPTEVHEYWSNFLEEWNWGYEETLENALAQAISLGLYPRISKSFRKTCREFGVLRSRCTIPVPFLAIICNWILPLCPSLLAYKVFHITAFIFRRSLVPRVVNLIVRPFHKNRRRGSAYEEYRQVPGQRDFFAATDIRLPVDVKLAEVPIIK